MIKNNKFIQSCFKNLKQINENDELIFYTLKKDRYIQIIKLKDFKFNVLESGYKHEKFENLDEKELKKLLKTLQKIEFPRSNQLWLKVVKND